MPTLEWIGKDKVISHHLDVPFYLLDQRYTFTAGQEDDPDRESGNKIIQGDNLLALKALLPQYEGKVKCIYIDPPYNTGNEKWVYNDNVNDPRIKKWLGEVVGKEGEDLTRHDKWLCMMYPRLQLLRRLLSDDGAIFISIDDNEQAFLKLICDEIFGFNNYVATFVWHSRQRADNRNISMISTDHEYVLCYSKVSGQFVAVGRDIDTSKYMNPDNDPRGPWASIDLSGLANAKQRPNLHYEIVDPSTGIHYPPNPNRGWSKSRENVEEMISEGRVIFPRLRTGRPREKKFLSSLRSKKTGYSTVLPEEVGFTTNGTREMRKLFPIPVFDYPKSVELIESLIHQATPNGGIILDSFAGSGTTAHAVLNLNKQDGGKRRFILVEMMDYAETITAERVRRVMKGYGNVAGTGGDFSFYQLGQPLFEDGMLNPEAPIERIREYVYYTETGLPFAPVEPGPAGYLGLAHDTGYYFHYHPHKPTVLNSALLPQLNAPADRLVVYSDVCLLSPDVMEANRIRFKKIPRDMARL